MHPTEDTKYYLKAEGSCGTACDTIVVYCMYTTITSINTIDWTDFENSITVNVTGLGDYEYSIDGIHYQDSNVFSNLYGGLHYVYVRDENNCGVIFDEVFLLNYAKFFTPNGDGYNYTSSLIFSYFEKGIST